MTTELEKLLGEEKVPTPPSESKTQEEDLEVQKKKEQLDNLNKAIEEANKTLRDKRGELKKPTLEEEIPKINFDDPSAKAWDKHIKDVANPAKEELEKAKTERRTFVLRQFLQDKPAFAANPEKVKSMMDTYEKLRTSTELTNEGILMDLEKAFAAENYQELTASAHQRKTEDVYSDIVFSDPAVSRGSTTYSSAKDPKVRTYSEDEKAILAKWGMTPAEHAELIKNQKNG